MRFSHAVVGMWRVFREEFFTLLMLGALGGLLCLTVVGIPFALGAHAALVDDIANRRAIGVGRWLREGRRVAPLAFRWGLLNGAVVLALSSALRFYGTLPQLGQLLQGFVLFLVYFWLGVQLFALPLLRLEPGQPLMATLRQATLLSVVHAPDVLLTIGFLLLLSVPLAILNVVLLLFLPLVATVLATALTRLHLGLPVMEEIGD